MIDDELLQELLAKASGLYNSGDYRGAITAWKEALATDPSSQKAREGIQMARLLLGDWEPAGEIVEESPAAAADGADAASARLTPAQRAARVDEGVARVRALLRERQYSAAVEGARGLVPIDPDSDEVQRLVEEAQQAFESAPFIEEHLTLARELAAQERLEEAEAECHKVFALDPANPDAQALAAELRERIAAPASAADAGGVTMRMDVADLLAAQESVAAEDTAGDDAPAPAPAHDPGEVATTPGADVAALPDDLMDIDFGAGAAGGGVGAPAEPAAEASAEAGPAVAAPADLDAHASESAEPEVFDLTDVEPEPVPEQAIEPLAEEPPAQDTAEEGGGEEVVEAQTVVPATVRRVPRTDKDKESMEAFLEKTEDVVSIPLAPPPSPAQRASARAAAAAAPAKPLGWEEELESLNMKRGQHDIVGRSALKSATPAAPAAGDMDLSELLGDPADVLSEPAGQGTAPAAAADPMLDAAADAMPESASADPMPEPQATVPEALQDSGPETGKERAVERAAARRAARERPEERETGAPAAPPRPRASVSPGIFALLGVIILAGAGAVWWFVYQPKIAAAQAAAPPAGNPPAGRAGREPGSGPIPTPLGSTPRQPAETHSTGAAVAEVIPGPAPTGPHTAPADTGPAGAPPAAPATTPAPAAAPPPPATPRPSPEEMRRQAAQHLSDGRRLMAAQKWQQARTELAAALALDPVNFECKELLDQAQAKVEEEVKVTRDLEEARRAFADKDYQGALWKLYRLPHDPRLGNVDLYIRNAWYNWAVVGIKGGDATDARQKLSEVLTADPEDADAKKMLDVAERYSSRAKDRIYYTFADNLRFRAFDQK